MNQVTNLIQWKNHSKEQQAEFDFENYEYEYQDGLSWVLADGFKVNGYIYRLVIQPEKMYRVKFKDEAAMTQEGRLINAVGLDLVESIKPSKQPKPLSLESRVKAEFSDKRVVMLGYGDTSATDFLGFWMNPYAAYIKHIEAQSMKNFYKYVYEVEDGSFVLSRSATSGEGNINSNETVTPVAVLFSEQP